MNRTAAPNMTILVEYGTHEPWRRELSIEHVNEHKNPHREKLASSTFLDFPTALFCSRAHFFQITC